MKKLLLVLIGMAFVPGVAFAATPSVPLVIGNAVATINQSESFTIEEPELIAGTCVGNQVRWGVDWNNDGTVDQWSPASGYTSDCNQGSFQNAWSSAGTYTFHVLSQWSSNGVSSTSTSHTIVISNPETDASQKWCFGDGTTCGKPLQIFTAPPGLNQTNTVTIGADTYLAAADVSSAVAGYAYNQTNTHGDLYKWQPVQNCFGNGTTCGNPYQGFTSNGFIVELKPFTIGANTYLAAASDYDSSGYSNIYVWTPASACFGNGTTCGTALQRIQATGSSGDNTYGWDTFTSGSETFLASQTYLQNAQVFVWMPASNCFGNRTTCGTALQTPAFSNSGAQETLHIFSDSNGNAYLLHGVNTLKDASGLYAWMPSSNCFGDGTTCANTLGAGSYPNNRLQDFPATPVHVTGWSLPILAGSRSYISVTTWSGISGVYKEMYAGASPWACLGDGYACGGIYQILGGSASGTPWPVFSSNSNIFLVAGGYGIYKWMPLSNCFGDGTACAAAYQNGANSAPSSLSPGLTSFGDQNVFPIGSKTYLAVTDSASNVQTFVWMGVVPSCSVSVTPNPVGYGGVATLSYTSASAAWMKIASVGAVSANTTNSIPTPAALTTTDYSCTAGTGYATTTSPAVLYVNPPVGPTATITADATTVYIGQSIGIHATFGVGTNDILTHDNIDSPVGTGLGATTNPDARKDIVFAPTAPGTYTFYARATTAFYTSWATARSATSSSSYVWTAPTSGSGYHLANLAASDDGTKMVSATTGSTVYTSTDSGTTWTPHTITGSTHSWVGITASSDGTHLAMADYSDGATAGVKGYLYTSTDSGATWTQQTGPGKQNWESIAASANGSKIIVSDSIDNSGGTPAEGYIYISTDYGVTWTRATGAGEHNWMSIASSADGMKLAAIYNDGPGASYIYTSADGGTTWTQRASAGSNAWWSITSSVDGTKLAATSVQTSGGSGYIYTSTDSGATWTQRASAGTGPGNTGWGYIISSSDGTKLLAVSYPAPGAGYPTYIYTSIDGGATWTQQTNIGETTWGSFISLLDGTKLVTLSPSPGYPYFDAILSAAWQPPLAQVSVTVPVPCTAQTLYSCTGSTGQTIASTTTDRYCNMTTTNLTTCVAPAYCPSSGGSGICLNNSPTVTKPLTVTPSLVSNGKTTQVYWNISNVSNCTVKGSNGDGTGVNSTGTWNTTSSGTGGMTTSPITSQTVYILKCLEEDGVTYLSQTATVSVAPSYQER
jgi:hypothetical protein